MISCSRPPFSRLDPAKRTGGANSGYEECGGRDLVSESPDAGGAPSDVGAQAGRSPPLDQRSRLAFGFVQIRRRWLTAPDRFAFFKLDASRLERALDVSARPQVQPSRSAFEIHDRLPGGTATLGELHLGSTQKGAGGAALRWGRNLRHVLPPFASLENRKHCTFVRQGETRVSQGASPLMGIPQYERDKS